MNLLEYIKKNYTIPNKEVLRGLGANEKLINYLMKTSENTNLTIASQLIDEKSDEPELIATVLNGYGAVIWDWEGKKIVDGNITLFKSFEDIKNIINNHEQYDIFMIDDHKKRQMPWYEIPTIVEHEKGFKCEETEGKINYYATVNWILPPDNQWEVLVGSDIYDVDTEESIPTTVNIYVQKKN